MKNHNLRIIVRRGIVSFLLLVFAGVPGTGCIALLDYRPDEGAVDKVGIEEAKRKLSEVLAHTIDPVVNSSEITDDYFRYQWQQTIHGAYGIPMGAVPGVNQIYFKNIEKLEVYVNNKVFIYERGGRLTAQVLFPTVDDAKAFADLVMSFRARRLTAG